MTKEKNRLLNKIEKIKLNLPTKIEKILRRYDSVITGGFIRDTIRGKEPNDLDIIVRVKDINSIHLHIMELDFDFSEFSMAKINESCFSVKIPNVLFKDKKKSFTVNISYYIRPYDTIKNIIGENFDFNINMLYISLIDKEAIVGCEFNGRFSYDNAFDTFRNIEKGILKVNPNMAISNIPRTIKRLGRFIEEGYTISSQEMSLLNELIAKRARQIKRWKI